VQVKQRNLIDEYGKGFMHFNFVVKETNGKLITFFAELHPNLKGENDVYLCIPLDEKDLHPSEDHEKGIFNIFSAHKLHFLFNLIFSIFCWSFNNALVFFLKLTVTGVKIGPKILYTPVLVAFWVVTKTLDFLSWNSRATTATTRAKMMMNEGFMCS
jgi:hypothetical protein